jgi:hypothetical protein
MALPGGFERPALGLEIRCSVLLSLSQGKDMPTLEWSTLIVLPTLEFGLRVQVVADQASGMGL